MFGSLHEACAEALGIEDDDSSGEHVGRHRAAIRRLLREVAFDPIGRIDENLTRDSVKAQLDPLAEWRRVEDVKVQVALWIGVTSDDRARDDHPDRVVGGQDVVDAGAKGLVIGRREIGKANVRGGHAALSHPRGRPLGRWTSVVGVPLVWGKGRLSREPLAGRNQRPFGG
ncbi:MAG TPA: hypothetical protein VG944_11495 [Fimbriimonas sp.]|nr:hypothetical protein [Fimbriimonas sp.]